MTCCGVRGISRVSVSTGGRSVHSSLVNLMAGCNAANTASAAPLLGTHLNWVSFFITLSRHAVANFGTPVGLTNLAKPYASTGDCAEGVPVIIHNIESGCRILLRDFHRLVDAFLYALASSTMTKSNRPSRATSSAIKLSPS